MLASPEASAAIPDWARDALDRLMARGAAFLGARYAIMQTQGDQGRLATTPVYEVPADSYFLLADNRDNAVDSRLPEAYGLGFVPFENFVGRADIVLYSLEADLAGPAVASHIRWDRILQRVR